MAGTNLTLHDFNTLFPDEDAARAWFERARWPDGPACYHCGVVNDALRIKTRGTWECRACGSQFSVTGGTPMHRTHLPLPGRAVVGVFHFVSPKHLGRYAGEAAFRWNRKKTSCLDRMASLIRIGDGRLLPYDFLTGAA